MTPAQLAAVSFLARCLLMGIRWAQVELYVRHLGEGGLMASSVNTSMHAVRGFNPSNHSKSAPSPRHYTAAMSMVHTDAVFFEDDKAFETWLVDNASTATHVWIRMAKKATGIRSIDWTRAVDVALCFGWIDGIARRIDDEWYVQRFTPRRAKSVWSKINRERIERLTAEGRMRPAGLAQVEEAKADGRWDAAYDSPATAVVPDDLAAALAARDLTDVYAALDGRNRFAFLNRIQTAVRPETRTRRIEQLTDALAQGKTPYPAPPKKSPR